MLARALDSHSKTRGHSVFPALSSHGQMLVGCWLGKVSLSIFGLTEQTRSLEFARQTLYHGTTPSAGDSDFHKKDHTVMW